MRIICLTKLQSKKCILRHMYRAHISGFCNSELFVLIHPLTYTHAHTHTKSETHTYTHSRIEKIKQNFDRIWYVPYSNVLKNVWLYIAWAMEHKPKWHRTFVEYDERENSRRIGCNTDNIVLFRTVEIVLDKFIMNSSTRENVREREIVNDHCRFRVKIRHRM